MFDQRCGCSLIFSANNEKCQQCGSPTSLPQKTDEYLKTFLEIDDQTLTRFKEIRETNIQAFKQPFDNSRPLKAIGISGSARDQFDMASESSNSEFLLKKALEELETQGVVTELLPLRQYNIKPCKACYSTANTHCHFPCSCYPRGTDAGDDMSNLLYDKILAADIIIFATPINNFKMSSHLSLLIDRCISLDGSLSPADPSATKNRDLNIKHAKFVTLMSDEAVAGSGFVRRFAGKSAGIIVTGHEEGASLVISSLFMTLSHFGMSFAPWSNMYAMSSIMNQTHEDKKLVTAESYVTDAKRVARNVLTLAKSIRHQTNSWHYDPSSN